MGEHTISDLSALSGLPVRTIRYYVAQGLIPSAGREGPGTRYPEATLARLRLIARLRDAHLPLAEIRRQLGAISDGQAVSLAGPSPEPDPAGSALDYVRSVLGGSAWGPPRPAGPSPAVAAPRAGSAPPAPILPAPGSPLPGRPEPEAPAGAVARPDEATPLGQRSQWERIAISPDIELHLRRPLSRRDNRLVERLVAFARQLQEEQL